MAIESSKLNLFSQLSAFKGIEPTKAVGGGSSSGEVGGSPAKTCSNNPFGESKMVGVNTNIGVGDTMNIAAQAGKKPGIGRTLGFA